MTFICLCVSHITVVQVKAFSINKLLLEMEDTVIDIRLCFSVSSTSKCRSVRISNIVLITYTIECLHFCETNNCNINHFNLLIFSFYKMIPNGNIFFKSVFSTLP